MKIVFLCFITLLTGNSSYACSFGGSIDNISLPSFIDVASYSKNVVIAKYVSTRFIGSDIDPKLDHGNFLPEFEISRVIKGNITDKTILVNISGDSCDSYNERTFKFNKEYVFAFKDYKNISKDKSLTVKLWNPESQGVLTVENNSVTQIDIRSWKDKRKIAVSLDYLSEMIAKDIPLVPFKTQEEYNKSLKDAP